MQQGAPVYRFYKAMTQRIEHPIEGADYPVREVLFNHEVSALVR